MVELTIQLSDDLAKRIEPIRKWLPIVLEFGLVGFTTSAVATATEIIEFLSQDPSLQAIMEYRVSERAQARLVELLALNDKGLLSEIEEREMNELQRIEHIIVMLKVQIAEENGIDKLFQVWKG